jgi:uncharacterized protein related to proFAR isomerase
MSDKPTCDCKLAEVSKLSLKDGDIVVLKLKDTGLMSEDFNDMVKLIRKYSGRPDVGVIMMDVDESIHSLPVDDLRRIVEEVEKVNG